MHTRLHLALSLMLAISMVGISYGANGILPGDGLSESTAYLIEDLTDFDVFADPANAATYWSSGVYTRSSPATPIWRVIWVLNLHNTLFDKMI